MSFIVGTLAGILMPKGRQNAPAVSSGNVETVNVEQAPEDETR